MRSMIDFEMPLLVALQHSKSGLFSKFHFTCFEWITHGKLFRSNTFNLQNLCAAGTEEGPILLISKLSQSIVPVSLLCVHKTTVTDIAMSNQMNTFLSVSSDGLIAGWHCQDGSCCFSYENLLKPGDIKIVLSDTDTSVAWFWSKGFYASLIDLKSGVVLQNISFIGLSSFSLLKKYSNFQYRQNESNNSPNNSFSKQPLTAIMIGINSIRHYQVNETTNEFIFEKEENKEFDFNEKCIVTPYGIIRYRKNFFAIYLQNMPEPVYSDIIDEVDDDDMISFIDWKIQDSLLVCTFKGLFKIYKIKIVNYEKNNQQFLVENVTSFSCNDTCILTNPAFNRDIGYVIFATTKTPKTTKWKQLISNVVCVSMKEGEKFVQLVMPQHEKICCIQDPRERIVIQAKYHSSYFEIFDWETVDREKQAKKRKKRLSFSSIDESSIPLINTADSRFYSLYGNPYPESQLIETNNNSKRKILSPFLLTNIVAKEEDHRAYITSLACHSISTPYKRLLIMAGASDGKLYFFYEHSKAPSEVIEAILSPIIGIVILPIPYYAGRPNILVVGQDGSFALVRTTQILMVYSSSYLPIASVGFLDSQKLLVIQKIDNSYHIYDLDDPDPLQIVLSQPLGTTILWSKVQVTQSQGIQSTLTVQIEGASMFYNVLEVSKLFLFQNEHIEPLDPGNNIVTTSGSDSDADISFNSKTSTESSTKTDHMESSHISLSEMASGESVPFQPSSSISQLNQNPVLVPISSSESHLVKNNLLINEDHSKNATTPKNISPNKENKSMNFTLQDIRDAIGAILEMMTPSISNLVKYHSHSLFSNITNDSVVRNSRDECGLSFALVGHKNMPTFFYPMYKLSGPNIFDTSPFIACLHYIAYMLMSDFLDLHSNTMKFINENRSRVCGFISVLTQLLFLNDTKIQKIASLTLIGLINPDSPEETIPLKVCHLLVASYVHYFDKQNLQGYDYYLIAILMTVHPEIIELDLHLPTYQFILTMAKSIHPSNFLAFMILLSNFEIWAVQSSNLQPVRDSSKLDTNFNEKRELALILLLAYFHLTDQKKDVVTSRFIQIVSQYFDIFVEASNTILLKSQNKETSVDVCQFLTTVATAHPNSIGTRASLAIAYLASSKNQYFDVFNTVLKKHLMLFKEKLAYDDYHSLWIITMNDGYIHVFRHLKFLFKDKISNGPIYCISISPGGLYAAAVLESEKTLVKIDLKTSMFQLGQIQRIISIERLPITSQSIPSHFRITWKNSNTKQIDPIAILDD